VKLLTKRYDDAQKKCSETKVDDKKVAEIEKQIAKWRQGMPFTKTFSH
jgi:hypothetical protein